MMNETYLSLMKKMPKYYNFKDVDESSPETGGILHEGIYLRPSFWRDSSLFSPEMISSAMRLVSGGKGYKTVLAAYEKAFLEKNVPPKRPFISTQKCTVPFLSTQSRTMAENGSHKEQSLADHLVWAILCSSGNPYEKTSALFGLLQKMDNQSLTPNSNDVQASETLGTVSFLATKSIASRVLELLGVPIPYTQVSNQFEEALIGCETGVMSARLMLSLEEEPPYILDVTFLFKELSQISHTTSGTRNIFLPQEVIVQMLFEYYPELNALTFFPDSVKIEVVVCTSPDSQKDYWFIMDEDYFREMRLFFAQQNAPNKPKSLEPSPDKLFKPFDFGILSDFSLLDKVLNCSWEQIEIDDVHKRIGFQSFHFALHSNPMISWALSSTPLRQQPKAKLNLDTFSPLIKFKVLHGLTHLYSASVKPRLSMGIIEPQVLPAEPLNEIENSNSSNKPFMVSNRNHVSLKNHYGMIDVPTHRPIAEILHFLDCQAYKHSKEKDQFPFSLVKEPESVTRAIVCHSKGPSFPLDEHMSFVHNILNNPVMQSMDKIKISVYLHW